MELKTGEQIFQSVLDGAGATLPQRDSVDRRIINEIRNGTGTMINSQQDVGGLARFKIHKSPSG